MKYGERMMAKKSAAKSEVKCARPKRFRPRLLVGLWIARSTGESALPVVEQAIGMLPVSPAVVIRTAV
jgi:hypothetical protein